MARFRGGRCLSTLELATLTIEMEGVFLCNAATRERFCLKLNNYVWQKMVLLYSEACDFYYKGKRGVPLQDLTWSSIARFGSARYSSTQ